MPAPAPPPSLPAAGTPWYSWGAAVDACVRYVNGVIDAVQTAATAAIPASQKGAVNGVAQLDSGRRLPSAQLPAVVLVNFATLADAQAAGAAGQLAVGQIVTIG